MAVAAAFGALLVLAMWKLFRRQAQRRGGPLADVPDAPPSAVPMEAPGLTLPYSSLDPFAPPKPRRDLGSVGRAQVGPPRGWTEDGTRYRVER